MAYLFRQKLNIEELSEPLYREKRILIYEPEYYLSALYGHYLRSQNFDIKPCLDLSQVRQAIFVFSPQLLIFSVDAFGSWLKLKPILQGLVADFPNLNVVSTGYDLNSDSIKELMEVGLAGHINRRLSRPKDLAVLAQALLNN